jgi:two-component system chemotaxis response regulator CheB
MKSVRVLIIDDSALVRELLTALLGQDPGIEVVGAAPDAYIARTMIKTLDPDVLTLDIEMPRMDGVTFLRNVMRLHPMPVVMVSSLTAKGAQITLQCLALGAVDFVSKPKFDESTDIDGYAREVIAKIKGAAADNVRVSTRSRDSTARRTPTRPEPTRATPRKSHRSLTPGDTLIGIAASTGGVEAIHDVLEALPADVPPVVVAQHIPATFSAAWAKRINRDTAIEVREAADGEEILHGHAYIAAGGQHLAVMKHLSGYICRVTDDPPVNHQRPSCDTLFRSVAKAMGASAIGVILTGMGEDGARGLLEMQARGAKTIAQDEATSVVWGMPGTAVSLGAVDHVLPLEKVAARITQLAGAGCSILAHSTTPR